MPSPFIDDNDMVNQLRAALEFPPELKRQGFGQFQDTLAKEAGFQHPVTPVLGLPGAAANALLMALIDVNTGDLEIQDFVQWYKSAFPGDGGVDMTFIPRRAEHRFAELMRHARQRGGMSRQDFEEKSGIDQSRISSYERGQLVPTTSVLIRIAKVLGEDPVLWWAHIYRPLL